MSNLESKKQLQRIKQFNFFNISIVSCLLISIYQCSEVNNTTNCSEFCSQCNNQSTENKTCISCKENFQLDKQSNKCICNKNLFYQSQQNDQKYSNQCVALCSNNLFGNKTTNRCEKLEQCSTFLTSSNQLFTKNQVIEAHKLSNNTFITQYKEVFTLMDIQSGNILKTLNISDDVMIVKVIKGIVFLFDENNKIFQWNINNEQKQLILDVENKTKIQFNETNNFIYIKQSYICAMIVDQLNNQTQFRTIFDLSNQNQDIIKDNNQNKLIFNNTNNNTQLLFFENIIINKNVAKISIEQIVYKEKLLKEQICFLEINSTTLTQTSKYYYTDNILAIKFNQIEIIYINKEKKICRLLEIKEIKSEIESIKVQEITNSNDSLLVIKIKEENLIYIYNTNSTTIQKLNISLPQESILDHQITYLQTQYPEIVILTNSSNIYTFQIDTQNNKNITQNQTTELQMINNKYIIKIQLINQNDSTLQGILLLSSESLTLVKRNSINQKIEQSVHINYQMPFPAQLALLGKIIKIIIIEVNSYLVQCTENGYIQIFDISSGYEAQLIKTLNLKSGQCIDIQSILSEKIIVVSSNKIVIINLFNCVHKILFELNQENNPSISVNGQYTVLSLNGKVLSQDGTELSQKGCIFLYENTQDEKVFEYCEKILQERILSVTLSQDLVLYLFSNQIIKQVQIDLKDIKLKELNITIKQYNITKYEIINVSINDQLKNEFYIDEILIYDESRTLRIFNKNLEQTHSVSLISIPEIDIKNPNMIKRSINDSSVYVLIESKKKEQTKDQQCTTLAFTKNSTSLVRIWTNKIPFYTPIIQSPIKLKYENGTEYFIIRQMSVVDTFNLIGDNIISPPKDKDKDEYNSYHQGFTYTTSYGVSYSQSILDLQNNKTTTYIGTEQGELMHYYSNHKLYQVIQVSKSFKNKTDDDEITQFVNFQIIEKYFILVKSYVLIYNAFTDELEDPLDFDLKNTTDCKISVIERNNLFIVSNVNFIFIRVYENKRKYLDYTYNSTSTEEIKGWLFDENDQLFYIYGQGLKILDLQLQQKEEILSNKTLLEKCIITQTNLICKLKELATLKIIEKKKIDNEYIKQTVDVLGMNPTFIMDIDTKYELLYLIEYHVQVYSLSGKQTNNFKLQFDMRYNRIDFQDEYLIITSQTNCIIFDRKSYEFKTSFWLNYAILKQAYISKFKSLIFTYINSDISQIFVYDIKKTFLRKISQPHPGIVVDFIYDGEMTLIVFLNQFGNLQTNLLYLADEKMNDIKFVEMEEKNQQALGFTIDFSTNKIYAYTKRTLFKANYAKQSDKYLFSFSQNNRQFTIIKSNDNNNNNTLSLQYLIISQNNCIFKYQYQDYQTLYQNNYKKDILGIIYNKSNLQVIIAFSDHLKVYSNYSYNKYDWKSYNTTEEFLFEKFVTDNIFITFDKKIVHYDYKNMIILQKIQLNLKSKLTAHLLLSSNSSNEYIVFGFQNGQSILYTYNKYNFIDILDQKFKEFQNKPITFILESDNLIVFISTNEGQIIQYNVTSNKTENYYELTKLINQTNTGLILSDLKYIKEQQRLLFIFIGQHGGYILDLKEIKILGYFSGGNNQKNTITLTNKYIIISSAFQLNFYQLSDESKFIGMIYGNPWYDQILSFAVEKDEIVIICYIEKFMIYYIQDQKFILIERQEIYFSLILEQIYDQKLKYLKLALLTQYSVSEVVINISYSINNSTNKCYSLINKNETQLIQKQVEMVQQRKIQEIDQSVKKLKLFNGTETFLDVYIDSEYISSLNSALKKQQTQQQIVLSPINYDTKNYILQQNSFTQLEQQKVQMKNFSFKINEKNIQDKFNNIYFNDQTEVVIWQNITFEKNQTMKGIQINFINLKEVVFFDINISRLIFSQHNSKQSNINCLFYFENVTRVYFYNLTIENNNFTNNSDYSSILYMKQVKEVYIYNVNINNNNHTFNIIRFDLVNKIELDNFKIEQNHSDKSNQRKFIILIFKGCKEIIASEIKFTLNKNISLISTVNYYAVDEQILTYQKDSIELNNLTLNNNTFESSEQIINISQSYVNITNMNFTSNEGNVKISNAKNITIQKSLFSKNKAFYGGAISVYNLEQNLTLIETKITQNEASISGGGVYLENIQTTFTLNEGNVKINDEKIIKIQESLFEDNTALNGGAISIQNLQQNLTLKNAQILQNKALGSGGGIYLENVQTKNIEFDIDCKIEKNSALIGGGVRILNKSSKQIIPFQYPFKTIVKYNNAQLYGNNTCTFIQNILVQNGNEFQNQSSNNANRNQINYELKYQTVDKNQVIYNQTGFLGLLEVSDFNSGGNLYLNIFFIDENQQKLKFEKEKYQTEKPHEVYPQDILDEIQSLSITFKQIVGNENSVFLKGETVLNSNLYDYSCNCFKIKQLSISSMPSQTMFLQIQFNTNIYINEASQILVPIQFRKCQIGEVIQMIDSKIQTCNFCQDGTYSLIDPDSIQNTNQDQPTCKKCNQDSTLNCIGNIIQLKNGYWREHDNTDEILSCNSQIDSCKSEDPESREQGCSKGFVGPLCEVCDLEGRVWDGQYTASADGTQCNQCKNLGLQYFYFILQVIGTLSFLLYNSFQSFQTIQYTQTCYYLRKLQILPLCKIQQSSLFSSFIKVIVSYLQFSSLLKTQQSFLPFEFNIMPNKTIALSMNCIISTQWITYFGKSFVLCIINSFLPIFYMLIGTFICKIFKNQLLPSQIQRKFYIYIFLSVIYTFFLLDTVQFFTTFLTCRQIGSYSFSAVDLLQKCNEEKHIMFLKVFSASVLILWTIFPLIMLLFLRKEKNSLNLCLKKFKYGYFYIELKNQNYYWELVRILLKLLVIIVNTQLKQEYYVISRYIIILLLSQYIKMLITIKPFLSSKLLSMEILSIQLIIAKILLQTSKEQITKAKIIFEVFIFLIDISFISYFILNVTQYVINNKKTYLGRIIQYIVLNFCSKQCLRMLTKQTNFITYLRWKKIKNNLQIIRQYQYNSFSSNTKKKKQQYFSSSIFNRRTNFSYLQEGSINSLKILNYDNMLYQGNSSVSKDICSPSKDNFDSFTVNISHKN